MLKKSRTLGPSATRVPETGATSARRLPSRLAGRDATSLLVIARRFYESPNAAYRQIRT